MGMENGDMPLGFSMQLAQNVSAMEKYANMTETQRYNVREGAKGVKSHDGMTEYIDDLAKGRVIG